MLNMRAVFLAGVSIAIVLGSVFVHYLPDYGSVMGGSAGKPPWVKLTKRELLGNLWRGSQLQVWGLSRVLRGSSGVVGSPEGSVGASKGV